MTEAMAMSCEGVNLEREREGGSGSDFQSIYYSHLYYQATCGLREILERGWELMTTSGQVRQVGGTSVKHPDQMDK